MARAEELFNRIKNGGEAAVQEMIQQQESEELFLDYKRATNNGNSTALQASDRDNLAKAISGFGNSEGGVILWGVDCRQTPDRGDVPTGAVPLTNPTRFKSWLEGATSGLTVPAHPGVKHHAIPSSTNPGVGFVVSLVPKSNHAPHQTVNGLAYYMRAGSNFARVPHGVLAGMFGRRPQPHIAPNYVIGPAGVEPRGQVKSELLYAVGNFGLGIAEDIFFHLMVMESGGENCRVSFSNPEESLWSGTFVFGRKIQLISKPGVRLAPEALINATTLTAMMIPPFDRPFHCQGVCGASGAEPLRFEVRRTAEEIQAAYATLLAAPTAQRPRYDFSKLLCPDTPAEEPD